MAANGPAQAWSAPELEILTRAPTVEAARRALHAAGYRRTYLACRDRRAVEQRRKDPA